MSHPKCAKAVLYIWKQLDEAERRYRINMTEIVKKVIRGTATYFLLWPKIFFLPIFSKR